MEYKRNIKFRLIDSFRFMAASLGKLSSYLRPNQLLNLKSNMTNCDDNQLILTYRKGVFPYDYLDSWSKYHETSLPPKEQFYSKLVESHISDNDYKHAQNVWKVFKIQNLGQYSDLYLKIDVLLLADVFENFRDTCHNIYKLDPAHYFTAPALSWDVMLIYTQIRIELMTDIDMILFVERGIRGGIQSMLNASC